MPVERVWCVCVSTVSAGQLHRSRGFHVRSIDQVFYLGSFTPSKGVRNPYLGAGFPLRCFQRLSLPNRITISDFRPCSIRRSRSQARLCDYTRHPIANRAERTFERLRYSLGGNRPS